MAEYVLAEPATIYELLDLHAEAVKLAREHGGRVKWHIRGKEDPTPEAPCSYSLTTDSASFEAIWKEYKARP